MNLIASSSLTAVQASLASMQALRTDGLQQLADATRRAFRLMWHNPDATPAQMAAALGTNAAAAFARHAATVQFLLSQRPGILAPEDYTPPLAYQLENDGSLTLV